MDHGDWLFFYRLADPRMTAATSKCKSRQTASSRQESRFRCTWEISKHDTRSAPMQCAGLIMRAAPIRKSVANPLCLHVNQLSYIQPCNCARSLFFLGEHEGRRPPYLCRLVESDHMPTVDRDSLSSCSTCESMHISPYSFLNDVRHALRPVASLIGHQTRVIQYNIEYVLY